MSTITFPTGISLVAPPRVRLGLRSPGDAMESPDTGDIQTAEVPFAAHWFMSMIWETLIEDDAVLFQSFLVRLRGRANRAALYHFERPVPRGTINTSGVTVSGAVVQGAISVSFAGCGAAKTLKVGDYFSVGGELKMVCGETTFTANGSGAMSGVVFEPPVRNADGWADAAAVTLDKPTALFIQNTDAPEWETRAPILTNVPFDFREVFS